MLSRLRQMWCQKKAQSVACLNKILLPRSHLPDPSREMDKLCTALEEKDSTKRDIELVVSPPISFIGVVKGRHRGMQKSKRWNDDECDFLPLI